MGVRVLLALLLCCAAVSLRAEEAKPQKIELGPVTLELMKASETQSELRLGSRVLLSDFQIEPGPVLRTDKVTAAVFQVWAGGNACGGWPAVVSVNAAGEVAVDRTFEDECAGFTVAVESDGILFVQRPFPGQQGSVWRYAPEGGFRRLGVLEFAPQPKSSWADLERSLDHPLSLFDVALVDAAARRLGGAVYAELATALAVAGPVEKTGERYLVGTGCQAHACNSVEGFIGIDRTARAVYFARRDESRVRTWPVLAAWPRELRSAFESWRKH